MNWKREIRSLYYVLKAAEQIFSFTANTQKEQKGAVSSTLHFTYSNGAKLSGVAKQGVCSFLGEFSTSMEIYIAQSPTLGV